MRNETRGDWGLLRVALFMLAMGTSLVALTGVATASGVTVTDLDHGATATGLANSLAGSGVSISNVTYTGSNRAAGTFTGGQASIGFDSGAVLDTGAVQTYTGEEATCQRGVEGPNNCYEEVDPASGGPDGSEDTTDFGGPGDSDLNTIVSPSSTGDAAVLEFDFVPQTSTVQFNYVFSSEEYSDYSNSQYNDVFAFLVNGTNCALVPGTSDPVAINTINNGNDLSGGDTTPHHPELFRDNVRPSPSIDSQMDGLTTVLTCIASVNAGVTNHMKLAIADVVDTAYDSAVFIKASSLTSSSIATSLSGGGQSGPHITVPTGTAVTDSATLTQTGTSSQSGMSPQAISALAVAGGTITYTVYSDPSCTNAVPNSSSTKTVVAGQAPDSDPVTLTTPGTYYWQATYVPTGQDPVHTNCGDETEAVTAIGDGGDGGGGAGAPQSDLALTKSDSPDPVGVDENLTYLLTATNKGPHSDPQVAIDDRLPAGVDFVSASTDHGTCSEASGAVHCDLGELAKNESAHVTIVVRTQSAMTLTNTAGVSGSNVDPVSANDQATATTLVKASQRRPQRCGGDVITISGTGGKDHLVGTPGSDVISGNGGGDVIDGNGGGDVICGRAGSDEISGGPGNDDLHGGADNDAVRGDEGADDVQAGSGNDRAHGNEGNDALHGYTGNDTLFGDAGSDHLGGGAGFDNLFGGDGDDLCLLGLGGGNLQSC